MLQLSDPATQPESIRKNDSGHSAAPFVAGTAAQKPYDTVARSAESFETIFGDELSAIERRRKELFDKGLAKEQTKLDKDDPLAGNLCGMSISGGGIRSATFALGVLQGLSRIGILSRFDYLSTVSGGGYIGSWFSAWIREAGFAEVAEKLDPDFRQKEGKDEGKEPNELRHLRYYSRYLAPRPGLFSVDGWVLITIYVRNFLLNLAVLTLFTLSIFGLARFVIELYSIVHGLSGDSLGILWLAIVGSALTFGAALVTSWCIPTKNESKPLTILGAFNSAVVLWVLSAFIASLIFTCSSVHQWIHNHWQMTVVQMAVAFAVIDAALCLIKAPDGGRIWRIARSFVAGLVGGLLLFGAISLLANGSAVVAVAATATFGVPLLLVTFVASNFLQIGAIGPYSQGYEREWWSAWNARLLRIAALWVAIFLISVYGPWMMALALSSPLKYFS